MNSKANFYLAIFLSIMSIIATFIAYGDNDILLFIGFSLSTIVCLYIAYKEVTFE
jgi:hypothetical protein